MSETEALKRASLAEKVLKFERVVSAFRAIRACIKRSHAKMVQFRKYREMLNIRFDSTVEMFESVQKNKDVLRRMKELGRRDISVMPIQWYLSADDFELIRNVITILDPVQPTRK